MRLRILFALLGCLSVAQACSVPVFRYALEHWDADPFDVAVFHRGALSASDQERIRALEKAGANLAVRTVDVAANPVPAAEDQSLPWVGVSFPRGGAKAWSGPLSEAHTLVDSPARREIAQRLSDGESAVWVLLESGNRGKDDAAAQTLAKRLDYLGSTLALPKLEEQDIANGLVSVGQDGLRLHFSSLRLSRSAASERALVQMLLGTEPDLAATLEPMVFPIFGRGRALYALVGEGIRSENIDRAATFLIGKCSCEVKERNPGVDLLMVADWDAAAKPKASTLPDLPTLAQIANSKPETVTIEGTPADKPVDAAASQAKSKVVGWELAIALLILVVFGGIAIALKKR